MYTEFVHRGRRYGDRSAYPAWPAGAPWFELMVGCSYGTHPSDDKTVAKVGHPATNLDGRSS